MRTIIGTIVVVAGFMASWAGELVPDFRLPDVNPSSARSASLVSPRDYLLQVSGYYFGHAG